MKKMIAILAACVLFGAYCLAQTSTSSQKSKGKAGTKVESKEIEKIVKSDEEWEKILTPAQFYVMRKKRTERAFTGELWDNHEKGIYLCGACGLELFDSKTKFESGTGWPSFWQPIAKKNVEEEKDNSLGMRRI